MTQLLNTAFAAIFLALASAVFAISFAAIIYSGDLAPFLDRGIALTLMGGAVTAVVGAATLSYRGAILAAQDVPAILIAGAAASMVAGGNLTGEALFATVACLVAVASLATGGAAVIVGQMKLAYIARFVPFPVLAGFLAATGLLLLIGGIGVAVGAAAQDGGWAAFTQPEVMFRWGPALAFATLVVFATRRFKGPSTLPLALIATVIGYYAFYALCGLSIDELTERQLMLGPFSQGGFLNAVNPGLLLQADWGAILTQVPVIVTVMASSLMGATLNASGLELAVKRDFDISREVRGAGIANILNGLLGGIPSYHLLGESLLAYQLGIRTALAGISAAAGCVLVFVLGGDLLSLLPVGLFGTVVAYLGLDLLYTWMWEERRRLGRLDYATVAVIPLIAVTFGFLTAIAVGLLIACAFFVVAYAKLDFIRSRSTVAVRRSRMERPDTQMRVLTQVGGQVEIVELSGFLFFGTANTLRDQILMILDQREQALRVLVIDFAHVSGMDVSTIRVLQRLRGDCAQRDVTLILSAMPVQGEALANEPGLHVQATLNSAIFHAEEMLLADHPTEPEDAAVSILRQVEAMFDEPALRSYVTLTKAAAGDVVVAHDSPSQNLFLLLSGQLAVALPLAAGQSGLIAQIRPGAIVGELAYYTGTGRSADIIAETPCELLLIDMDNMPALERDHPQIAITFHKLIARNIARRLNRTTKLVRDLAG